MTTTQNEISTPSIEQHEVRITALEKADEQTQKRLDALERNHNDLKVTIMEENRDTRKFMQSLIERQVSASNDDKARDDDLRKVRMTALKDILLGIFGAGGVIYGIIELFLK